MFKDEAIGDTESASNARACLYVGTKMLGTFTMQSLKTTQV